MIRLLALAVLTGAAVSAAAPPARPVPAIAMAGMHFGPAPAGLKAGDTIVFVNRDIVAHTATARDHSFDVVVQPRQSARVILRHAGNIAFYCRFHPTIQGMLAVAAR